MDARFPVLSVGGPIHFPPFRLDVVERRLYRGSTPVALRPKTFAVLHCLVQRPGRLVTKDDLLSLVWPDTAVGDAVLKVSVRELREALGDDPRSPRFIETAHRAGYRFVGEVTRSNLPVHLTSFVGRAQQMAEIARLLDQTRLATLTGAGGSGKTRLAAQVAAGASLADGAWWVDLAPLSDAALVPQTAMAALGLQEQPGRSHVETLALHLQARCLLLVLDNCEHVLQACAGLAEALLRACPELRILATSREPLAVAGETVWPVPPLALPDAETSPPLEELVRYEAVRLFVERARSARPPFEPEPASAPALARICRRLDGLPLAIELAAPRVTILSLEELAARLDGGLRILTASAPRSPGRHQTLQATIDWSYGLLAEEERTLLARLSVFAGGWTLAAAEQVCGGAGIEERDVLDHLARLVDKSLVLAEPRGGETRYRLLETVRQYGQDKLSGSGHEARVKRRHLEFYLGLAEDFGSRILVAAERATVLTTLGQEHDNLRAALRHAAETGDTSVELRLCHALYLFWFLRGCWSEGRAWFRDALDRSAAEGRTKPRGRVLAHEGTLACFMGDPGASSRLEESASIHRELGDPLDLADALRFLVMAVGGSDPARAREAAEESAALVERDGSGFDVALGLSQIGSAAYLQRDFETAREHYAKSAELFRELRDDWGLVLPLTKLGLVAMRQGDLAAAVAYLKESVAVQREAGERWFLSLAVEGLGRVLAAQGHHERAARLLGAGEFLRETVGATVLPFYLYDDDLARGRLRQELGGPAFASLWAEGRAMTIEQAIAYALLEPDVEAED
jgi:non-specific serine/threonine protein kinase